MMITKGQEAFMILETRNAIDDTERETRITKLNIAQLDGIQREELVDYPERFDVVRHGDNYIYAVWLVKQDTTTLFMSDSLPTSIKNKELKIFEI